MTAAGGLLALKARYRARLKEVLPEFHNYVALCDMGGGTLQIQDAIASLTHKLSGSGYTLGYPAISAAAAGLEAILEWSPPFSPAAAAGARKLVQACEDAIGEAPVPATPATAQPIIALTQDAAVEQLLGSALGADAPLLRPASGAEALQLLSGGGVRLLIADLDHCPNDMIAELYARALALQVPLLALASSRRLAAVAHALGAGRAAFLAKPAAEGEFSAKLRGLLNEGRRSVLLADDDEIVREFLKGRFEAHGFDVMLAEDGEQVIAQTRRDRPSIIVLDRAMPKMEGLAVLRLLKSDAATSDIPVVMLTQKSRPDQVSEGLVDGAAAYLLKPFSPDAVVAKCQEILDGRARRPARERA